MNYLQRKWLLNIGYCFCKAFTLRTFKTVNIIGASFKEGQNKSGVENGPDSIRRRGLAQELFHLGYKINDLGNIQSSVNYSETKGTHDASIISDYNYKLSEEICKSVQASDISLILGGDHSIAIGSVFGHVQGINKSVGLLWIDAHADINTVNESKSGHFHGMPVSFLIKEMQSLQKPISEFYWLTPCLSAKNIIYLGLRDLDIFEINIIHKLGIKVFTIQDIDDRGIPNVMQEIITYFKSLGDLTMHISFDIDALDPIYAPSTGTPVYGGLSFREGLVIMEQVSKNLKIKVVDLVEVNPSLGSERDVNQTCEIAKNLLIAAVSGCRQRINLLNFKEMKFNLK